MKKFLYIALLGVALTAVGCSGSSGSTETGTEEGVTGGEAKKSGMETTGAPPVGLNPNAKGADAHVGSKAGGTN